MDPRGITHHVPITCHVAITQGHNTTKTRSWYFTPRDRSSSLEVSNIFPPQLPTFDAYLKTVKFEKTSSSLLQQVHFTYVLLAVCHCSRRKVAPHSTHFPNMVGAPLGKALDSVGATAHKTRVAPHKMVPGGGSGWGTRPVEPGMQTFVLNH